MIKEITFDDIQPYWAKYLWNKYEIAPTKRVEVKHTQKNYCLRSYKYLTQEQIERVIKATYVAYFINGSIVGVESGYKTNKDYYRLRGLWVDKEYRRKGIATSLLNYLEDGCNEKYLWTCPRESALEFYLNHGFRITGLSEKSFYGQTYFAVKTNKKI